MSDDRIHPDRDPEATEPVEVQRYGPPRDESQPSAWHGAPAWSSRQAPPPPPPAARRGRIGVFGIVLVAILAGLLSGAASAFVVANVVAPRSVPSPDGTAEDPDTDPVNQVRIDETSAIIDAVERIAPAVVTIEARSGGLFPGGSGSGSGFIFDPAGWILTNKHVVEDADELTVVLNDSRRYPGEVYGVDTLTDLAILKIETGEELPAAPIGRSADLEPGQLAIAFGNPLGNYENTVTTGIISGLGRRITASDADRTSAETLNNLIQTDAAINPGNSGGPLANSAGQVIGVNTAVSTNAQGIGFAIPIDIARPIMQQALDGENLARPWIGVYYSMVDQQVASELDLPVDYGALIGAAREGGQAIFPGSPADSAGLRDGDVIVAVDGQKVDLDHDLSSLILPHQPGDTIALRILRGDATTEVEVTLGTLPADR